MKVLVTGHCGYIGSVLTPMLLERGHQVTGLDSDLFRACTFAGKLESVPSIEKDVRDITIEDVLGFDAIIHLAGLSNDPLGDYRAELTNEINFKPRRDLPVSPNARGFNVSFTRPLAAVMDLRGKISWTKAGPSIL